MTKECKERHDISVNSVLKKLGVSSSGYYSWKERKPSKSLERKLTIKKEIKEIHKESKEIYGAPKIRKELEKRGYTVSQKTVSKYMREEGIRAVWIKKYVLGEKLKEVEEGLKNVLNREFNVASPNKVWVTDITYIWTEEGWCYLSSIMDLYSRRIISWDVTSSLEVESVLRTLRNAKETRNYDKTLVIHSDRGSQYRSLEYKDLTKGLQRSYSRRGNPWDNAVIESFHSIIKRECLNRYRLRNIKEAKYLIFEYIETFYNTRRLHSYCGMMSPLEYERRYIC